MPVAKFRYTTGNILESEAEVLVNPVNCMGVMGKGLALAFKERYPKNFTTYQKDCQTRIVQIGLMYVTETNEPGPRYIVNFPTKIHWKDGSNYAYIQEGLIDLIRCLEELGATSVAIPRLGCGLGGLDWTVVRRMISDTLSSMHDIEIIVYQ